jgi:hypothetical protein
MEGGRGTRRVELSEPAHGLAGGQRLHRHAALLELLDRVGIGPHAAVGAGAHNQVGGKLVQDLAEVVEDERVAVLAPPVRTTRSGRMMRSLVSSRLSTTIRPNS